MTAISEPVEDDRRFFEAAWAKIDAAVEAHRELAQHWSEFCDADGFRAEVVPLTDDSGRLDVVADWPSELAQRADSAATSFVSQIKCAFDEALVAAAAMVSGSIMMPDRENHKLPLCSDAKTFKRMLKEGALHGLRPDQIAIVWQFQPIGHFDGTDSSNRLRRAMLHLAEMISRRAPQTPRVAAWAHSAAPEFHALDAAEVEYAVRCDGVLEHRVTVADFVCSGGSSRAVQGNPGLPAW